MTEPSAETRARGSPSGSTSSTSGSPARSAGSVRVIGEPGSLNRVVGCSAPEVEQLQVVELARAGVVLGQAGPVERGAARRPSCHRVEVSRSTGPARRGGQPRMSRPRRTSSSTKPTTSSRISSTGWPDSSATPATTSSRVPPLAATRKIRAAVALQHHRADRRAGCWRRPRPAPGRPGRATPRGRPAHRVRRSRCRRPGHEPGSLIRRPSAGSGRAVRSTASRDSTRTRRHWRAATSRREGTWPSSMRRWSRLTTRASDNDVQTFAEGRRRAPAGLPLAERGCRPPASSSARARPSRSPTTESSSPIPAAKAVRACSRSARARTASRSSCGCGSRRARCRRWSRVSGRRAGPGSGSARSGSAPGKGRGRCHAGALPRRTPRTPPPAPPGAPASGRARRRTPSCRGTSWPRGGRRSRRRSRCGAPIRVERAPARSGPRVPGATRTSTSVLPRSRARRSGSRAGPLMWSRSTPASRAMVSTAAWLRCTRALRGICAVFICASASVRRVSERAAAPVSLVAGSLALASLPQSDGAARSDDRACMPQSCYSSPRRVKERRRSPANQSEPAVSRAAASTA